MTTMQFQWGSWQAPANAVSIGTLRQSMIPAANGKPTLKRIVWAINGKIVTTNSSDPQTSVMDQIEEIAAAFNENYKDVGFPGTQFYFLNADTFGGIVVLSPFSWSEVKGAEGVTFFRWSVAVEMYFTFKEFVPGTVLNFSETTSFTDNDGLPMYVERIPVNGLPILQQISTNSWFYGSQSGMIEVAGEVNAAPMAPFFPGNFRTSGNNAKQVDYQSPKMVRGKGVSCVTTWNYNYISTFPFFSTPNIVR